MPLVFFAKYNSIVNYYFSVLRIYVLRKDDFHGKTLRIRLR